MKTSDCCDEAGRGSQCDASLPLSDCVWKKKTFGGSTMSLSQRQISRRFVSGVFLPFMELPRDCLARAFILTWFALFPSMSSGGGECVT